MQSRIIHCMFALLAGLVLLAAHSAAQQFNYVSIDVSCNVAANPSTCPTGIAPGGTALATWATGITPAGQIVGGYVGADGKGHGFVYSTGVFTTKGDALGSLIGLAASVNLETEYNGINPAGDIVGDYTAFPGAPGAPGCNSPGDFACTRGFVLHGGVFQNVVVSNSAGGTKPGSVPQSINPGGSIYGCDHDEDLFSMVGFVRTVTGEYLTLDAGGGILADPTQSVPASMINAATPDGKTIVGLYTPDLNGPRYGFVIKNGVLLSYAVPFAGTTRNQIWGINPAGNFVGFYRNVAMPRVWHGFLQPADLSQPPIVLDDPQAVQVTFREPKPTQSAPLEQSLGCTSTRITAHTGFWPCQSLVIETEHDGLSIAECPSDPKRDGWSGLYARLAVDSSTGLLCVLRRK